MKIQITNHGSICLLHPLDAAADKWLHDTAPEDAQFFGKAIVVEPRYVQGVVDAFAFAGGEIV